MVVVEDRKKNGSAVVKSCFYLCFLFFFKFFIPVVSVSGDRDA